MSAGKYRDSVTFQTMTVGQDAYGGVTETPVAFVTVWAEVMYLRGRELWQAQQANSEAQGKVRIRFRDDIDPMMTIKHGTKTLEIISLYPADNRRVETEIIFKEALD